MTKTARTAYGYVAGSLDRRTRNESLVLHQQLVREYAATHRLNLSHVYVEEADAATREFGTRPAVRKLLETIASGDVLLIASVSEVGTRATAVGSALDLLGERRIDVRLIETGLDDDAAKNLLFRSMLRAAANMELENLAGLVAIKAQKRQQGRYVGGEMVKGYRRTADGLLVPDEKWSRCVELMRRSAAAGISYPQIADDVRAEFNIDLSPSTVHRVLAGKRHIDGSTASADRERLERQREAGWKKLKNFIEAAREKKVTYATIAEKATGLVGFKVSPAMVRRIYLGERSKDRPPRRRGSRRNAPSE